MSKEKVAGANLGPDWPGKRCTARSKRSGEPCRNPAVLGWDVCRMHGARGGRPKRSTPDWRKTAHILKRLDLDRQHQAASKPKAVTVVIAAGRGSDGR